MRLVMPLLVIALETESSAVWSLERPKDFSSEPDGLIETRAHITVGISRILPSTCPLEDLLAYRKDILDILTCIDSNAPFWAT